MTSESRWKRSFGILKGFILSNPEIRIGPNEVCIPEALRGGFYTYFDDMREAIVEAWNSSAYFDANSLSRNYRESEKEFSETLNVTVELPLELSLFLHNPKEGMMRLIYNRLFELVQGKIPEEDFEYIAACDLAVDATNMFRIGYEAWATIALIVLLEPDGIWGVALDDGKRPVPAVIREIAFGRQFHHAALRIPEFIFHSRKLDRYIAFKMPLAREVNAYSIPVEIPTQRLLRNRNGDSSSMLDHRVIFLSIVPDLEHVPVYADFHKRTIDGPDLAIEFLMEHDLSDSEVMRQIQGRWEILKPRLGGTLALMDPQSNSGSMMLKEDYEVFSVGLAPSRLRPIIDKFVLTKGGK